MNSNSASKTGILYIVATPIGNLQDITLRAIQTLKTVDTILAEDTRHSKILLNHLGIQKPLMAYHAHNESSKTTSIIQTLLLGQNIALISDAGTPMIADPGYPLLHAARKAGISVVPIPGPCAFVTALSAAGIPCDQLSFFGFLPAKSQARRQKLQTFLSLSHTLVFYESPHRIQVCLEDMHDLFQNQCEVVLAKELTKTFEQFVQGTAAEVLDWLQQDEMRCKGEFVVILLPRKSVESSSDDNEVLKILLQELPLKQAVKLAAAITAQPKNELYQLALNWQQETSDCSNF